MAAKMNQKRKGTHPPSNMSERGDVVGAIGFALDTTDHKEVEAEFRRPTAELQVSNDELERPNVALADREVRMIELKKQANELHGQFGQRPWAPSLPASCCAWPWLPGLAPACRLISPSTPP